MVLYILALNIAMAAPKQRPITNEDLNSRLIRIEKNLSDFINLQHQYRQADKDFVECQDKCNSIWPYKENDELRKYDRTQCFDKCDKLPRSPSFGDC